MDCSVPVDDLCEATQYEKLEIPERISTIDEFFILVKVDTVFPTEHEQQQEEFARIENTGFLNFWAPCRRIEEGNLSDDVISDMLSTAGVPTHKQESMVEKISNCANEMANAAYNKGRRVLPMLVSVSIVACFCTTDDYDD
ncbi:hypothetical protein ABFS82_09G036200 [Erythranthe guttata]